MKLEIWHSKDGWRFRIKARNGRIIASSEAYASRRNCRRAAARLKRARFTKWRRAA